jgi:hypothetical protein
MSIKRRVAALLSLALTSLAACSRTTGEGTQTWFGLEYDPAEWHVLANESGEVLANLLDPACSLRLVRGGSDLPPGWSVETASITLGPNRYETFEVSSPDRVEYVNYFYEAGDPTVNLGGFQVSLPSSGAQTCSDSAEPLLATLDPQGLIIPTGTAAG